MKQDGQRFTLENEELLVAVNRHGAELARIYDKLAGRELLWNADPAVWNRHAPILFPFVGKCYDASTATRRRNTPWRPRLCQRHGVRAAALRHGRVLVPA